MYQSRLLSQVAETIRSSAKLPHAKAIQPDSRLLEDLGIDSLDLVGVLLSVQDRFEVFIEDADIPSLRTVIDVVAYLQENRPELAEAVPERNAVA